MPVLHALVHAEHEGPARIAEVALGLGLELRLYLVGHGEPVPAAIPAGDLLLVMGGMMGVEDRDDPRYPFLTPEIALIKRCLTENTPIIGVCLGAQLLAHAAGGRVHPLEVGEPPVRLREVGWGAIHFLADATSEPVLAGLDSAEPVLMWHGDTFTLPPGAVLLGSTLACPNQLFRIGQRAWGLQFHVEITAEAIPQWVATDAAYVLGAGGPGLAQRILDDTKRLMPRHQIQGNRLLANILQACLQA